MSQRERVGSGRAHSPANTVDHAVASLSDALRFMRVLWELDHRLQRSSKRMRADLGVTGPQRLAIRVVGGSPGISAGELARVLHTDPSTLTGIVQRLEERGALERSADPHDGRKARFRLGRVGKAMDRLHRGTVEAAVQRALAHVTTSELACAERVLARVAEELARLTTRGGSKTPRQAKTARQRRDTRA